MILLIIKSYLPLLLSVGFASIFMLAIGLYLIFKKPAEKNPFVSQDIAENIRDLSAIAGDDLMTTQLDLARAYIETGRTQLAQTILASVIKQGNSTQQKEAKQLMSLV